MNELIMICILIIGILSIYLSNKVLKTFGIKIVFITFNLLSFILSFKFLTLSTFQINANIMTYCIEFTCISLLIEKKLNKEALELININLIINIFSAIILYLMAYYTQSINDTIAINMVNVFTNNYKILIIYPIATYISLRLLVYIYNKVEKLYDNTFISMVSTYLAVGLIYLIINYFIGYYKILKLPSIIKILLSTYMVELIIIVAYSVALTFLNSKKVKK